MKKHTLYTICALAAVSVAVNAKDVRTDSLGRGLGVYTNPAQLLQGQVSGVRVGATDGGPGGQINTNIRGLNSVRGLSEPLWIVDGALLSSSAGDTFQAFSDYGNAAFTSPVSQLDGLNIYDIASIEVLKNTTATALYGSRGANGVIIIRTKNPVNGEMHIDANVNAGITSPGGFSHSHNLALSSRTGRTNYRISAFYRDIDGSLENTGNRTFGMRVKFDTQSNKVVWFGLNTSFSIGRINSATGTTWYGSPSTAIADRGIAPLKYYDPAGISSLAGWNADYDDISTVVRSTSNFYLTFNFTKSLKLDNTLSFDVQDGNRSIWYGNGTAFGKERNGAAGVTYSSLFTLAYKSELSFERYFGGKHHVKALAAFDYIADWNKNNVLEGTDFFMHDLRAKGLNLKESVTKIRYFSPDINTRGGHALLSYGFGKIAGIEAAARYETNPRYDSGLDFRDLLYPEVCAWTEIHGYRLEGGLGRSGRNRFIPYEMLPFFTGDYPRVETDFRGYYESYNRVVSDEWHVGLSKSFLKNRVNASVTYYDRSSDDNLTIYCFGKPSTREIGTWVKADRSETQNQTTTVSNRGVELDLDLVPVSTSNLKWTVGLHAAYNANSLVSVSAADERGYLLNYDGIFANKNVEGESVSSLYGFTVDADNVVNGEGVLGNTVPKVVGGFNTDLKVGNLRLEVIGNAALGFDILNMNRMLASARHATYMAESVAAPFVEKGDFLRISRATLSYSVPVRLSWLKSLDVHMTGTNLLTLTRYGGYNPDVNSFGFTNMATGIDYGSYPLARCFMLGVSAKF